MTLYHMAFGIHPTARNCLQMLHLTQTEIPRFRDAWLIWENEAEKLPAISIMTRTGGGNRTEYGDENAKLTQRQGYLRDFDDEFDNTFAYFIYAVPEEYLEVSRAALAQPDLQPPKSLRERTDELAEQMKGPPKL